MARRKAQGVAKTTFKLFNEGSVRFACHPSGSVLLSRFVVASPRCGFVHTFVEPPRLETKSSLLSPMGIFEMGSTL
jgi:hypothetical protein